MGTRVNDVLSFFVFAGSITSAGLTVAQSYPTKPIRLIVPTAPGGSTDIVARMLAQKLTATFKQSVVVDNRPGGGQTIGTETAVRANPDGYTMIVVSGSYAANAALYNLSFDAVNDVAPVSLLGELGFVVKLHPSVLRNASTTSSSAMSRSGGKWSRPATSNRTADSPRRRGGSACRGMRIHFNVRK
jgi:tripartite-type tricarboxylate transporter receptor subunit TctC